MVFMTIFNIYGRILNCLGLKQYQFNTEYAEEKVIEGKYVIDLFKQRHMTGHFAPKKEQQRNDDENSGGRASTETTPNNHDDKVHTFAIEDDIFEERLLSPMDADSKARPSFEEVTGIN